MACALSGQRLGGNKESPRLGGKKSRLQLPKQVKPGFWTAYVDPTPGVDRE